jgi:RNA polymerase sigma-70 factor (ECF subfamily)
MEEMNLQEEGENNLVQAIRQGKQEAFGMLYDRYAPILMGMISRILPVTEEAEEVLKETFLAIWDRIHIFDPSQSRFLSWALALSRGIALEAQKTGKYHHLVQSAIPTPARADEQQHPHPDLVDAKVKEAFCDLEPQEKAVIDLIYVKGYKCFQAAQALDITEEELRLRLKSAFKHIAADKTT